MSDIRNFFYRDPTPVWHVCATPYTLLGMDEWVRGFRWVNYADCFDGLHPRIFVPKQPVDETFPYETLEEMNNDLLSKPETQAHIRSYGPGLLTLLFFDEETERHAHHLGLELIFPKADLRRLVDDKVESTRIAEKAGVACVPNVLGKVNNYSDLTNLARNLGTDWVVQTPFGDSGFTTYFISNQREFEQFAKEITSEHQVKIMKRIKPRQAALEACVTRQGTVVGPLTTEIVGFPELTPFQGGWAGNEIAADAFTESQRRIAMERTVRFGNALSKLGYRGYFEIDWLIDEDTQEIYLGEVNPRLTGVSPLTNLAAFAHADAPLFLFHLLEFRNQPFDIDIDLLNQRWSDPKLMDDWGQLIIKHVDKDPLKLTAAPRSGVWRLGNDGKATFRYPQTHRRTVDGDNEAFFLRIPEADDRIEFGDDVGVLVMPGRLLNDDYSLSERAKSWISAIREEFKGYVP